MDFWKKLAVVMQIAVDIVLFALICANRVDIFDLQLSVETINRTIKWILLAL